MVEARFGNLSALQFEDKCKVDFSPEDMQWIEEHRVDKIDARGDDGLHIFAMPLGIVAGSNIGEELIKRLRQYELKRHFYVETMESGS